MLLLPHSSSVWRAKAPHKQQFRGIAQQSSHYHLMKMLTFPIKCTLERAIHTFSSTNGAWKAKVQACICKYKLDGMCLHLYWFMNSPTSSCEYQASALTEPQNSRGCVQLCQFNACRTRPDTHIHTLVNTHNAYLPLHKAYDERNWQRLPQPSAVCHNINYSNKINSNNYRGWAIVHCSEI